MGDPKFSRRKYETPSHPWEGERIAAENELLMKYGLKNKQELWRAQSLVRGLRANSRELQARLRMGDPQARIETDQILAKCSRLGLLPQEGADLNDILVLTTEEVLARRFQTIMYRKGLAHTPKQARQFIVHGHVAIGSRKVTIPGYIVKRGEEELIQYLPSSEIANDMHPARPKPEELKARQEREEAVKQKAAAVEGIKVAKPKLEKLVKTELKAEEETGAPEPEPEADDDKEE